MKPRMTFDQLKIHPPFRAFRKGKSGVVGLDTESLVTGYAFLITDSLGNYKWVRSSDDVLSFLTNPQYRHSYNTFWNLDFDVMVLMKWLGRSFCEDLVNTHKATFNGVEFTYISDRYFCVRVGNQRNVFYDACQYYMPRALDSASKTFLGEAKIHVGNKEFHEADYGREDLLTYCKDDSRKCALLTQVLIEDLFDMGFEPKTLSSPGTIMEEALTGSVYFPDMTKIPSGALEYAYNAYKGGWVECFKRGHFKHLYDYDISSAYPYQVSQLIDLNGGSWIYRPKGDVPGGAVYGWLKGKVTVEDTISPIVFQTDANYTPVGTWPTYLTLKECNYAKQHGKFEAKDGWFFMPREDHTKPFHYAMWHLFRMKSVAKNKWLPKALAVSLYGKFAQKDEEGVTGNMCNFPYGSIVTSGTRLQLMDYVSLQPETLVAVITDGLTFDKALPYTALSQEFGGLRLASQGEGVSVGPNVMTIKGRLQSGSWRPGRYDWLFLLSHRPNQLEYDLTHTRPVTMREAIENDDFESMAVFKPFAFTIDVNFDRKRMWRGIESGGELMENVYESHPWEVGIVEKRRELWQVK